MQYLGSMTTPIATIPKRVSGGEELVVVKKSDFEMFRKWSREVRDALAKVERGRKEYKRGKTAIVSSPRAFR